jgi:hypothetical protein
MIRTIFQIILLVICFSAFSPAPAPAAHKTVQQYKEETGLREIVGSFHFTVFSHNKAFSRRSLDRLEEALAKICSDLHIKRRLGKKCLVFIWKDREDYLRHLVAPGRPDLAMTGGFAVSVVDRLPHQLYLYDSDRLFDTVIPHELGHLILEVSLNPSRRYHIPLWLHEGFAQCQEKKSFEMVAGELATAAGNDKLLPLKELTGYNDYPDSYDKRHLFYQQSEGLVRFLLAEQTTPGEFFYLARKIVFWAEDLEPAIRIRYNKKFPNLNRLEESWIKYIKSYFSAEE